MPLYPDLSGTYVPLAGETRTLAPGEFVAINGAPTNGDLSNLFPYFQFSASADERVATQIALPSSWATYHVDLLWGPFTTGGGNVKWDVQIYEAAAGEVVVSAPNLGGTLTVAAPAVESQLVVSRLATGVAHAKALTSVVIRRDGANAADTCASVSFMYAVVLTRAT